MEQIRVLIADDHRDFRRAIHEFLDRLPNVSVIGEACDGNEAVEQVERLAPDVVLMDIRMPHKNGLEATRIIKDRWPATKVLISTLNDDVAYRKQAQEAKADGFIVKSNIKPSLQQTFSASSTPNPESRSSTSIDNHTNP